MRRASCRSVPIRKSPPAFFTSSYASSLPGLPPSLMSTPWPAMLVATVTLPLLPALATFFLSLLFFFLVHGDRADQRGLRLLVQFAHVPGDGLLFSRLCLENEVLVVFSHRYFVRRYDDRVEAVDLVELFRGGNGGARHAGQFAVQAEVILKCDARECA